MVYPEVVARLPVAPVWSVLFFFMLLTLGLDSQFALMETVTTAILDAFTSLRERKTLVVLGVSCFGFLGGLIFTTHGGLFWLELLDHYAANYSVLLIATMECVYVAWFYGSRRFLNDIQSMIGRQRREWKIVWTWVWKFLTPATLLFILVFNWIQYEPLKSGSYVFPTWSNVVGWCFSIAPVTAILVIAGVNLYSKGQGPVTNRLWSLFQPGTDWGPAHLRLKKNRSTVLNGFPGGLATIPEFNFSAYEDDDDEGIRMGHSSRDTATAIQAKNLMFLKHQDEPS
ncbi:unnamed protein product [Cyprideis torosa]|uniref:Uncharacterized protein n=1 Tax=Cyprideis torosa TaxID=163714 RepID=A0A7R8W8U9_9CRUS|nr:unnamed protein product [Cyprideis torosa]CAG0884683.1 unnamed protein product [Cyprideis torosa]